MDIRHSINLIEAAQIVWYHRTTQDRLDNILQHGLRVGSEPNLTDGGEWSFQIYGSAPIFLSKSANTFYAPHAPILLAVEVSDLKLVADLPSLVDHGAYYDESEGVMWWKNSDVEYSFDELLTSNSAACDMAIQLTGTAACFQSIPTSAIRLIP